MTVRRLACILVASTFTLVVASHAAAQEDADAMIAEGVSLRGEGRDAEALERFERAHEHTPTPRALAQIALAEQALGRWVDAHDHLLEALGQTSDPWIAAHRDALDGALARIREHVGHLEVVEGVEGAEVRINGEAVGVLPLASPLTVPVGTVVLEVRAPGHVAFQRSIQVRAGGRARERVVLVARSTAAGGDDEPAETEPPPSEPATRAPIASGPDALSIAGSSVLGVAGLAGVAAAIVGMAGAGACVTMEEICIEQRDTNWVAVGLYGGLGLAAVIGGVIWLAVALSGGGEPEPSPVALTPNGVAVAF